jgi:anthranilate phosphoribosyltransferase
VLAGKKTPLRDIAILNAAAALVVAGKAASLKDATELAAASIQSGAAQRALDRRIAISNGRN